MKCTINFYSNTQLKESANYCLDASTGDTLETFLADKYTMGVSNYQLQKPLMDLIIKIDRTQQTLYYENDAYFNIDYCSITPKKDTSPTDGKKFYYFVIAKRWTAQDTIALELRMDTLNTFNLNANGYLDCSKKTIVEREHKDRFTKLETPIETILYHKGTIETEVETMQLDDGVYAVNFTFSNLVNADEIYGLDTDYYDLDNIVYRIFQTGSERELFDDDFDSVDEHHYFDADGVFHIEFDLESSVDYGQLTFQLWSFDIVGYQENIRKIDIYPEGITPTLYKQNERIIADKFDTAWNLVYRSGDSSLTPPEPVVCQLVPDASFTAVVPVSTFIIAPSDLTSMHLYDIYQNPNPNNKGDAFFPIAGGNDTPISVIIDGTTYTLSTSFQTLYNGLHTPNYRLDYTKLRIMLSGGNIVYEVTRNTYVYTFDWDDTIDVINVSSEIIAQGTIANFSFPTANSVKYADVTISPYSVSNGTWTRGSTALLTIKNINEIDRTDSRLYKIIKLPYCPSDYEYVDNTPPKLTFDGYWEADNVSYVFKLDDLNAKFKHTIKSSFENPIYKNIMYQFHSPYTRGQGNLRNDDNESKLFHSDFYQPKFVYDSFTFVFQLEKIRALQYITLDAEYFTFEFVTTSTINSKFLFVFPNYVQEYSTEDYDNVLPVARNNEVTIYNNEYLNYLRTAYNYDLKAKERTISTAKLGLGLGIAGSVLSAGVGLFGGGSVASKFSAVGSATTSITGGIVNTINTIASAEEQFASKQETMKAQSFSVSGSDDVDLMEYYSSNRAKLVEYAPSERMKKALADLFYYCGYATNEQKIPAINTREYFNFLKCQLVLENICYNEDVTNDLIAKFNEGVTFIHKIAKRLTHYDIEKTFTLENSEVSLIEE